MGAAYTIFGRQVPTYKLALATYALVAAPIVVSKATKKDAPANVIVAASQDEESFIREFLKAAESDEKHV